MSGNYGIGWTSKGEEFYFDLEDYDKIKDYCWFLSPKGYVIAKDIFSDNSNHHVIFHRLIWPREADQIDHIGNNKQDNRKCNLREVNNSKNQMNQKLQKNNKSGYHGVTWHKRDQIWEAHIGYNKQQIYIGRFTHLEDAVKARKEAEEKYFQQYAYDYSQKIYKHNLSEYDKLDKEIEDGIRKEESD